MKLPARFLMAMNGVRVDAVVDIDVADGAVRVLDRSVTPLLPCAASVLLPGQLGDTPLPTWLLNAAETFDR